MIVGFHSYLSHLTVIGHYKIDKSVTKLDKTPIIRYMLGSILSDDKKDKRDYSATLYKVKE